MGMIGFDIACVSTEKRAENAASQLVNVLCKP